jgi:hypothetical protein
MPVGPAPTITKCRSELCWVGVSVGMEAFSKRSWMRVATRIASLALRRKSAFSDTPGVPNVLLVLCVMFQSHEIPAKEEEVKNFSLETHSRSNNNDIITQNELLVRQVFKLWNAFYSLALEINVSHTSFDKLEVFACVSNGGFHNIEIIMPTCCAC